MVQPPFAKGYVTLITVMIVGAITAATAVSLLLLGLGSSQGAAIMTESYRAQALADTCAEAALEQIALSSLYIGEDSLTFEDGGCTFAITAQTAADGLTDERKIAAAGHSGQTTRRIIALVDIIEENPTFISWHEVADF